MDQTDSYPYATHLDIRYPPLELVDIPKLITTCTDRWYNQTLCQVNGSVVRLGIVQGEYHWHKHDNDDEFFFVIDGRFMIDLEDSSVELQPRQGFVVPVGVVHRTRAPERAVILMVFGFGRIPIVSWLRDQANESLTHAQQVGEWITTLGAYPSLAIGPLLDSHKHDIAAMLKESLDEEARALALYRELLTQVEGRSLALEEFAREMVLAEELHAAEVDKMLRKPGDIASFSKAPH